MHAEGQEGAIRTSLVAYSPLSGKDTILRVQIPDWIETDDEVTAYEWGFRHGVQMRADQMKLRALERSLQEGTGV